MGQYEYKVVPAPDRARKEPGAKSATEGFALELELLMNDLANDGWEYLRADSLPAEERSGFGARSTKVQNVLVFRRERETPREAMPLPDVHGAYVVAPPTVPSSQPEKPEPPVTSAKPSAAAAAAAAAALTANRQTKGAPPVGPARRPDDEGGFAAE